MARHPIEQFRRWYAAARRRPEAQPDGMALATADGRGRPSVRFVLLKGADEGGFTFYTHTRSAKGRDLAVNPRAALVFYWHRTGRQVRVTGRVVRVAPEEADAYWATRPRPSQLGAWASAQSRPVGSRAVLLRRAARATRRFRGRPIPRPAGWTGYRLIPATIEFWTRGPSRLHDRVFWRRTEGRWHTVRLQP